MINPIITVLFPPESCFNNIGLTTYEGTLPVPLSQIDPLRGLFSQALLRRNTLLGSGDFVEREVPVFPCAREAE